MTRFLQLLLPIIAAFCRSRGMISNELLPFLLTGLTVALLHAALPTHWLPFVLAGRAQKWSFKRTASILFIAGAGHVLTTSLIGAAVVWFGIQLHESFEHILVIIASLGVLAYGVYNIWQHFHGIKHSHCDHHEPHHHDYKKSSRDGWAVLSLLAFLTFSPCESFLPVYVSAWQTGWVGFGALTLMLTVGTLLAMFTFMSLAYYGMRQFQMNWLEDHERLITGIILILLSILIYVTESAHHLH